MTLAELIARVRTDANDKAMPYFWSDAEITAWINDAEAEAAVRGRLIHESEDKAMCRIGVQAAKAVYPLHAAMVELDHIAFKREGATERAPIMLVSTEWIDESVREWRDRTGTPSFAVQSDKSIRLVPIPDAVGELLLEGYRMPKTAMEGLDDEPEINSAHHRHLVHWALHRGFSIPDTEAFDPNRAAQAEAAFTQYFGQRPDSDLRRATREDVPHHVEAFWP